MKLRYLGSLLVLALIAIVLVHSRPVRAAGGLDTSALAAASIFKVVPTPNEHPTPEQNNLNAAAASSPSDIWAVGQSAIHFDGSKWAAFPAPLIKGDNTSLLGGVAAFSFKNAWAVGFVNAGEANPGQVIEHWNGSKWSVFKSPQFNQFDQPALFALTAISATDMWAAGSLLTNNTQSLFPLFEHWDGTSWTPITTPDNFATIFGVSAVSSKDVWAVGDIGITSATFIEHWDGTGWTVVPSPSPGISKGGNDHLNGVVALAPKDVWAVGFTMPGPTPPPPQFDTPTRTLIEHFDGVSWKVVPSPNVGPHSQFQSNRLLGLTAVSPADIWAFGSFFAADGSGHQMTLLLHWNGTKWSVAPSPNPVVGDFPSDILFGGVVPSPRNVWIVGSEQESGHSGTLVLHTTGG
jgi:hypothetical protein